jgi:hypothetical protein
MKFLKELQIRLFPFLVALSALSVSVSAAFYSVTGLSKLFAGAKLEVLIMASSLEIAKLIIASLLYQYWDKINKVLRFYLTTAALILVVITSLGIYGFLSSAYQQTANQYGIVDKEVNLINLKKDRFIEKRENLISEKEQLDQSIASLRNGLANNQTQRKDSKTGQIITTISSENRKTLNTQINESVERRDIISQEIEVVNDSITKFEIEVMNIETNSETSSELGPLKYISELTGAEMNKIVNYLLLVIVFVFDPLAISLVIAANFLFDRIRKKKKDEESDDLDEKIDIIEENKLTLIKQKTEEEVLPSVTPTPTISPSVLSVDSEVVGVVKNKRLVYKKRDDSNS